MSDVGLFVEAGQRIRELRGNISQAEFAARLDVDRKTVVRWEAGERLPDGQSLLALMGVFGADVNYLLSGQRGDKPAPTLTAEEQTMLSYFREASKEIRRAALGALLGASAGNGYGMNNLGAGAVQVGHAGGKVTVKKGR